MRRSVPPQGRVTMDFSLLYTRATRGEGLARHHVTMVDADIWRRRAGALAASLMLAACASTAPPPPEGAEVSPEPTWWRSGALATATPDAALSTWWAQFQDADLTWLVQTVQQHNSEVYIAQATLRQAQAARAAVEAQRWPQLGVGATASSSRSAGTTTLVRKLSASASWEPDVTGAQAAQQSAEEANVAAAVADLATTQMSLAAEMAIAYVQWRDAQARWQLTRTSAQSLADTLALTAWRAQAGLDSALALEQARLNWAQTEASLPSLAAEVATYEHQMALLTGMNGVEMLVRLRPQADLPDDVPALQRLSLGVPADVLRRRPDLRSAEAAVRAQWATREQTRRTGWPAVSLNGSLGWQALSWAALGTPGTGVAALAASIDWTLWDGGQRQALVTQQDALLEAAQWRYAASVRSALKDVEDALVSLRSQTERGQTLAQAARAAEAAARLSAHQRQAGLIGLADLLSAQRTALSAQLSLQTARTERLVALIGLYKALGGGWTP